MVRITAMAIGAALAFTTGAAWAADVIKANNANALNLGTSWTSGTAPTTADVAVWNNTVTAANSVALGSDLSWQGIRLQSPGGKVTITGAANTLTLGSAGIGILTGTQQLEIQSRVALLTSQTWTLSAAPAASQSLVLNATTQPTSFAMGGNTLDVVGSGTVRFTSGSLLTGGTINVRNTMFDVQSGGSRTSAIGSDVTINVAVGKILRFGINSAPGSGLAVSSSAAIVLNSGTILIESSGAAGTNRLVQSGPVSMGNGSGIANASGFGYATQFTGGIAVTGSTNWTETGSGTATSIVSGSLSGSGLMVMRNNAAGRRVEFSGDNSSFTGTVNLAGSSGSRALRLSSTTAGSSLATWVIGAGNTLDVDGVEVALGTLSGLGSIANANPVNAATVAVSTGTFGGILANGVAGGTLGLTKVGTGVLALTGANTYTGPTLVQAGSLLTTTAQTGGGDVTVADGATFGVSQAAAAATFTTSVLTLGSAGGSTLSLTPTASASAPVVTASAFTVNGPTTLALTANAASGLSLVDYTGSIGGSGFGGLSLSLPFRVSGNLVDNVANTSVDLANVQVNTPKWTGAVNAVWDVNTTGSAGGGGTPNWIESASLTPTTYIQAGPGQTDSVIFDDTATGPTTVNLVAAVTPVSITVNNSTLAYTISGTGSIGGTTGIVKNGSQSLTLATANTFSGGITLTGGTLNLGHAQALGSGPLALGSGVTIGNTSGSDIVAAAPVAQTWADDFTYAGPSSLDLGTAGSVTMLAGSQVTVSSGTLAVGGISGSGQSLTKAGAGTLVTGANSYSGATTVSGGTLRAASTTSFTTTSGVTLANVAGATLDLNGFSQTITNLTGGGTTGGNVTLGGATLTTGGAVDATIGSLSGAGGLVKTGTAQLAIRGGVAAFTGTTSITGGSVDVGPVPAAVGTLSMTNGGVLQGSGTLTRSVGTGAGVVSSNGGFAARGGNLVLNLGGTSGIMNFNSSGNAFGGNFVFGTPTADSKVIVTNDIGVNNNGGARTITVNAGAGGDAAEFTGSITPGTAGGVSGITKNGDGRLIYSGSNTYSGTTTVNAGILQINHRFALQNSVPLLSGTGILELTVGDPVFGGLVGSTDLASMVAAGYGSVTSLTLNPNAGFTRTYSGVIANGAAGMGLTKSGPGTQVLEAASTYTGPTSVTGGALTLAAGGSIDASPVVTVGDGAIFDVSAKVGGYVVPASQTLAGSGTVVGPVVVGGGATLSPGSGPGTLSFAGDLSWNAAGNYNWQMLSGTGVAGAADSWDLVNVTGALSIAATSADPFRINLWTLTGTSPGVSGPASNFDPSQNYNWRIASAAGGISGFAADKFLISTSATNGTGGFANTTYGGTFSMIQSGNDLELVFTSSGTGMVITIHVESGTQTQTQAGYPLLSGDTPVVKTGAGTLVVDQANTLSGSTTVQGGVLQLANGSALSASRLVVVAGGTGQVAPVTATSVASLDLASGNGLMDLTSGALTISSGLTATELVAEILEGRGDGSWTGTSGITSSTAAAESAAGTPRAVGWIDNGDGSLTAAYAAPGDTNIDWSIDILDAANFLSGGKFDTGSPAIWFEGDFSYDGIVDILDAADFFATGLYDAGSYNTAPGLSGGIAAVPEPATWTLLACGLGLLAASGRRRRR